ncbi:hypothetical protein BH09BAC2_BH09BAC2_07200 [soil metagenome]
MKSNFTLAKCMSYALVAVLAITQFSCKNSTEPKGEPGEGGRTLQYSLKKRFEQEYKKVVDPATGTIPMDRLLAAKEYVKQYFMNQPRTAVSGISWVERGPTNVGGRTHAILWDKNDVTGKRVFAGGVSGGLWRNDDITANTAWVKVTDQLDNIAITSLVQDQASPNIMYMSTGDEFDVDGTGIFKSTDGGTTWLHLGSTILPKFDQIQKIMLKSDGSLWALTHTDVSKSTDGGLTWTSTFAVHCWSMDIAANGDIYVGTYDGRAFKSTNASNGAAWTNLNLPVDATNGDANTTVACAPSNSLVVYVVKSDATNYDCNYIGQSTNGGTSWTSRTIPTIVDQGSNSNFVRGQGFYDLVCTVDQNTANTVWIGGIDGLRSTDGGATWVQETTWSLFSAAGFTAAQNIHADHHALVFKPGSSSQAVWGTDGGVFYSANANIAGSTKATFAMRNSNFNVTQFYFAGGSGSAGSNVYLAGAQDNGTTSFSTVGINNPNDVTGGDGAYSHIDPLIENNQYAAYVYNNYYKTTNNWASSTSASYTTGVNPKVDYGQFINPTVFDSSKKMLYGDATLTTDNTGNYFTRWTVSGTTVSRINCATFGATAIQAQVAALTVSPNVSDRIYFGIDNGSVVYINGCSTGTAAKTGTVVKPQTAGVISCIAIEKNGAGDQHMLVTSSNYGVPHVYETTNGGTNWTNISGNLPDIPVRWVIFDPRTPTAAIIATELGVWSTSQLNGVNTEWTPTNKGLANTRISMVKARYSDNTLYAASYGRGLFTSTLSNPTTPEVSFRSQIVTTPELVGTTTNCAPGSKTIQVPVSISVAPTGNVDVTISAESNSTATSGTDYSFTSSTVQFTAADFATKNITLTINDDKLYEGDEVINLKYVITAGPAARGTTIQNCEVKIVDDETQPVLFSQPTEITGLFASNVGPSGFLEGKTNPQKKIQYLYTKAELDAAGVVAGLPINQLAYTMSTGFVNGGAYTNFTFKIAHATIGSLTTGTFASPSGSFTTVMSGSYTPTIGVNTFTLGTPFTWNGTDNVLMEFCYSLATALTADNAIEGQSGGINGMCRQASTATGAGGCAFAAPTAANIYKPIWTVTHQAIPQTVIEDALNNNSFSLNATGVLHYFTGAGKIMGSINNTGGFNYGCTSMALDRAGLTTSTLYITNRTPTTVMTKTFFVNPANVNATGTYTATFYFTAAEVTAWQTATSATFSNIQVIKTPAAISSYSIGSPAPANSDIVIPTIVEAWGNGYRVTANFTTGFSGFAFGIPSGPIPVTLMNFSGALKNGASLLQWTTSQELNTKSFEIERSADGITFTKIGTVAAAGNSSSERRYTFVDRNLIAVNYYRLNMVDIDGKSKVSNVVLIKNDNMNQRVYVLTNPFSSFIDLQFAKVPTGKVTLRLLDLNGKQISSGVYNSVNSNLRFNNVTSVLGQGIYILEAEVDGVRYSYKMVKL